MFLFFFNLSIVLEKRQKVLGDNFLTRRKIFGKYTAKKSFYYSNKKKNIINLKNSIEEINFDNLNEEKLTEDGGVTKKIIIKGNGYNPEKNSTVKVHYTGKLENGQIFDSSLDRKEPYIFQMDQGKVIKGWEIGIKTMEAGEKSVFRVNSKYGYKKKGIPPIIPPNANLSFEIELIEILATNGLNDKILKDSSQETPKTPEKISQEFEKKISQKEKIEKKNKTDNFFFISPFQSQTGEKAPWWLNPNITFVLVFLKVFLIFYLVLSVGGIHQGYIDQI